jgi:Flp pilus assembly protein TadB
MRKRQKVIDSSFGTIVIESGRRSFPFLPGVLFLVLGSLVLFAPKLIMVALAAVLFLVGASLCFLAWKFLQFKRQLSRLSRDLDGRIQVQAFHIKDGVLRGGGIRERDLRESALGESGDGGLRSDEKKIIIH